VGDAHFRHDRYWWLHLVRGVAAIVIALIAIAYPSITVLFLAVLVAVWAFVIGFAEITQSQAWRLWSVRHKLRGGTKATREGGHGV
jgi:uncharacterized membrane protein HdeD (DUF308 family)